MINDTQLLRYSRHILLDDIDMAGQQAILSGRVLVVGCGGLAHPALAYLVSSGVGHITLVDDDTVDASNLQRQFWFTATDINQPKAQALSLRLRQHNPDTQISSHIQRADESFLATQLPLVDVVLDCTDNYATRQLINRCCFAARKPLVSASALVFAGQLAVYDFRQGHGPCYQCLFDGDFDDSDASCAKNGVFAPLLGIMGAAQANEALKLLANLNQDSSSYLHCFDARTFQWQRLRITAQTHCPICGSIE
ncbi:HesA/MoeB/ThiF family protein [Snodgrassella sp. CFCC 13594]|uniref:HesA/MoeB/ThiF family protein n=1 Tax=Snodgrassella sp. CFCC 13594 TaxID=1775559 RepID=UPI000AC7CE97|nr:HesA/MoeB/ThiF family protein [Snodgrassella sp. CFCC 13594]